MLCVALRVVSKVLHLVHISCGAFALLLCPVFCSLCRHMTCVHILLCSGFSIVLILLDVNPSAVSVCCGLNLCFVGFGGVLLGSFCCVGVCCLVMMMSSIRCMFVALFCIAWFRALQCSSSMCLSFVGLVPVIHRAFLSTALCSAVCEYLLVMCSFGYFAVCVFAKFLSSFFWLLVRFSWV